MGLLNMEQKPQIGGLLGGMQSQAPQQGQMQVQQGGQGGGIPPELMQAIEQMRDASPEQKQAFMQQIMQKIQSAPRDPAAKQKFAEMVVQALG